MAVLVVSQTSALSLGLASKLDVVGVDPVGLAAWLRDHGSPDAAIVDDAQGPAAALDTARLIREHAPAAPLIILVSAGVSPDQSAVDHLAPVRLVRRPFTSAQLADEIARLGSPGTSPRARTVTPAAGGAHPQASLQQPAATSGPLAYDRDSLLAAIRTLLSAEDFVSIEDAGDVLLAEAAEVLPEHDGAALMVHDGQAWSVAAGHGLRPSERRVLIAPTHWLMRRMADGETAVIVSGTDVARQELQSVPLANLEYWMATTVNSGEAIVIVARTAGPEFTVRDALRLRDRVDPITPLLNEALLTRRLAQHLAAYST